MTSISLGEKRVRIDFNVSDNSDVTKLKESTALLINLTNSFLENDEQTVPDPEKIRLIRLAQTAYEEACMWAVKAVTL